MNAVVMEARSCIQSSTLPRSHVIKVEKPAHPRPSVSLAARGGARGAVLLQRLGGGVCVLALSAGQLSSSWWQLRSRHRRRSRLHSPTSRGHRTTRFAALQRSQGIQGEARHPFQDPEASKEISDADIRVAFQKFDKNANGSVSPDEFLQMCLEDLHVDLTEIEVGRLFATLDTNMSGDITFASFRHGIRRSALFRSVVFDISSQTPHTVPDDYDFEVPTYVAHRSPDYVVDDAGEGTSSSSQYSPARHGELHGDFAEIKAKLDYSWHTNYTEERQAWQDQVVRRVALCAWPQNRPWVVFTCGAMGSGKGHVMSWLSRHNIFPLEHIIHIDPDHFKNLMPEWKGYTKHNSEIAGRMCHKESGFIQEIAQEVAMVGSQNVWIDGSLGDYEWYSKVFADIRKRFPKYRIALLYTYCTPEQVMERAERRGRVTGRKISVDVLQQSIIKTQVAVEFLGPLTDFSARINNAEKIPYLEVCQDRSHSFVSLRNAFHLDKEKKPFPEALDYQSVCHDRVLSEYFQLSAHIRGQLISGVKKLQRVPLLEAFKPEAHNMLLHAVEEACGTHQQPENVFVLLSPAAPVNMDGRSRELASIPETASCFCMLHGCCTEDWSIVEVLPRFQQGAGSFVYMDGDGHVVGVNTMRRRAVSRQQFFFQCSAPQPLPPKVDWGLELGDRWVRQVTPPDAVNIAAAVAWLMPGELPECPFGGFAYRFSDGKQEVFFPVAPGE